jgi:hypothetical protein
MYRRRISPSLVSGGIEAHPKWSLHYREMAG